MATIDKGTPAADSAKEKEPVVAPKSFYEIWTESGFLVFITAQLAILAALFVLNMIAAASTTLAAAAAILLVAALVFYGIRIYRSIPPDVMAAR